MIILNLPQTASGSTVTTTEKLFHKHETEVIAELLPKKKKKKAIIHQQ